jgi:hypothetical protein
MRGRVYEAVGRGRREKEEVEEDGALYCRGSLRNRAATTIYSRHLPNCERLSPI